MDIDNGKLTNSALQVISITSRMRMMMTSFASGRKQTKESTNPLCPFSARHSIPIYNLPSPQRGISLQIAENIQKQNLVKKFDRNFFACKFLKTFENDTQT